MTLHSERYNCGSVTPYVALTVWIIVEFHAVRSLLTFKKSINKKVSLLYYIIVHNVYWMNKIQCSLLFLSVITIYVINLFMSVKIMTVHGIVLYTFVVVVYCILFTEL